MLRALPFRPFLVIGCGSTCKLHPANEWFSVDLRPNKNPNLRLDYEHLEAKDFSEHSANSKFKFIFLEQICPKKAPSINTLKDLLTNDGGLIFFGSQKPDDWRQYALADLKINSFMYSHHVLILALDNCSIHKLLERVRCDLVEVGKPDTFIKFMNLVEKIIIEDLADKYDFLDPILISAMAHLLAYVKDRSERPVWPLSLYGARRNPLKDAKYNKFAAEVEKEFVEFGMHHISYEAMLAKIKEWEKEFPSSIVGAEKLDYNKLSYLLAVCSDAITFYAKKFIVEQKVRPGIRNV